MRPGRPLPMPKKFSRAINGEQRGNTLQPGAEKSRRTHGRRDDDCVYGRRDESRVALVVTVEPAAAARRLGATSTRTGGLSDEASCDHTDACLAFPACARRQRGP